MNKVRGSMTVFCLAVFAVALLGWRWSEVLPPAKQQGARFVLGGVMLATGVTIAVLWTARMDRTT